jgi:hypothetical protein
VIFFPTDPPFRNFHTTSVVDTISSIGSSAQEASGVSYRTCTLPVPGSHEVSLRLATVQTYLFHRPRHVGELSDDCRNAMSGV